MGRIRDGVRVPTISVSYEDKRRVKSFGFVVNRGTDNFSGRIITRNGVMTAEEMAKVAEAAEKYGNGEVALTSRLTLEVIGIPYDKIDDFREYIGEVGLETGGTGAQPRPIISCKGTVCRFGLIDTFEISEQCHDQFYKGYRGVKMPHKFKIAVGGCPNNCMKPTTNDVAIVGQLVPNYDKDECVGCKVCNPEDVCPMDAISVNETDEGRKMEIDKDKCNNCGLCVEACPFDSIPTGDTRYLIAIGGRWGKITHEARPMPHLFETEQEVYDAVESLALLYREQGITGERMDDTVNRIGVDNILEQVLSGELLERKDDIINGSYHGDAQTTC